jgi:hypothetical protein
MGGCTQIDTLHTAHTAHPLGGCAVRATWMHSARLHKLHIVRCVQRVQDDAAYERHAVWSLRTGVEHGR